MRVHSGNYKNLASYPVYEVFCDGKKLDKCYFADDLLGIAKCFVVDEDGHVRAELDLSSELCLKSITHKGQIKIVQIGCVKDNVINSCCPKCAELSKCGRYKKEP